jgi:hypothetical protein
MAGHWMLTGNYPQRLAFTRGLIRTEHHAYNPTKDGIVGTRVTQSAVITRLSEVYSE